MSNILILGAGSIGSFLYEVLVSYGHHVMVVDSRPLRPSDSILLSHYWQQDIESLTLMQPWNAIVNCLPHQCTRKAVDLALKYSLNYFDFTEDIQAARDTITAAELSCAHNRTNAFAPGCGLAPGYIEIIAASMVRHAEKQYGKKAVNEVEMFVGGNPQVPTAPSYYATTWSLDGLVNQYVKPCTILLNGQIGLASPLSGLVHLTKDHEAFFTSGGHGQFFDFAKKHKIPNAWYKTIRVKGHHFYMRDLLKHKDINFTQYCEEIKKQLQRDIAVTVLDEVKIKVKIRYATYPEARDQMDIVIKAHEVLGKHRTAMQIATVGSAAQVIDFVLKNNHKKKYQGFVAQTSLPKSVFKDKKNFPELCL